MLLEGLFTRVILQYLYAKIGSAIHRTLLRIYGLDHSFFSWVYDSIFGREVCLSEAISGIYYASVEQQVLFNSRKK